MENFLIENAGAIMAAMLLTSVLLGAVVWLVFGLARRDTERELEVIAKQREAARVLREREEQYLQQSMAKVYEIRAHAARAGADIDVITSQYGFPRNRQEGE